MAILSALHATACPLLRSAPPRASGKSFRATHGQVSWSAGPRWWLAAASGLPRLLSCRAWELAVRQALPGRAVRRGELSLGCLAWPSRQAPLAGVFVLQLGVPASSSCQSLVSLARQA